MIGLDERLRHAREAAGFDTAVAAAEHFGWKISTYAGHENGSRSPRDPTLANYARAFGVSAEWLRYGAGTKDRPASPKAAPLYGLSESMVTPFTPQRDRTRTRFEAAARAIAPDLGRLMLQRVTQTFTDLALLAGDVLICDLAAKPAPGDIVIVNVADEETGTAETIVGRFFPPILSPAGFGDPIDSTSGQVTIYAVVAGSMRPPRD